ncbi:hypothetical protein AVEN_204607-1 [Araneus ventricosus]|uniref:Uncharacterized protein n=1 Tax=Araneus ventricosus TaxID=182803 RepID=A0A4Y2QD17_ARAVE|nr:hypothetical protein AVEN_99002-1 [Araneus ventricosus]GBN62090.1 hypothetical protein AVEN_204607-1 [Araneus ventricosus]
MLVERTWISKFDKSQIDFMLKGKTDVFGINSDEVLRCESIMMIAIATMAHHGTSRMHFVSYLNYDDSEWVPASHVSPPTLPDMFFSAC